MSFVLSGAWICHTGKVRKANEDSCLFGGTFCGASASGPVRVQAGEAQEMVAVADGIGGHRAGAFASREVVEGLAECTDSTPEGVTEALQVVNKRLYEVGQENADFSASGAAVVGLFAGEQGLFAFNIGDARLYRQEGDKFIQITQDDSVEQMLVTEGIIEMNEGIRPVTMHALTQSVGGSCDYMPVEPHFHELPMEDKARFLLCTDGLTDMLSLSEIERIAGPIQRASAVVQALFTAAMEAGGRDNITIALVDVERQ